MKKKVDGDWEGWDGDTVVRLSDGSVWRQEQYYYEYRYAYCPHVIVENNLMHVEGMSRAVKVRRID